MVVQIEVKAKHANLLGRLAAYIRDPFRPAFIDKLRMKLRENIRSQGNRSLPYHTYPSKQPGFLEDNSFVESSGKGKLSMGSYVPYAATMEDGRRAIKRRKHPIVFRGYYPNTRIIGAILKKSKAQWIKQPVPYFSSSIPSSRGRFAGKVSASYKTNLSPDKMKKQNIRHIKGLFEGNIAEMQHDNRRIKSITNIMNRHSKEFDLNAGNYKYGIYTVFAYHVKAIPAYHVYSKTAEWAKKEFEKTIVRRVLNYKII